MQDINFCASTISIWQMVGYFFLIVKILIPIVLILKGILALGKAVISDDDKEIKKNTSSLIQKFIIAVFIFFLPALMSSLYPMIKGFDEVKSDYDVCMECITKPKGNICKTTVDNYNSNNS